MIDSVSEHAGNADFKKQRRQKQTLSQRGAATLDRLPPHDLQMEMGVLGCIMLSPNECMGICIEKLKDDGKEAFYDLRHQEIYQTLATMYNARQPVDLITVQQNLKERDMLTQVGGIPHLSQIQDGVPSAANLSWYLDKLREKFLMRRLIETCTGIVGRAYDFDGEVDQLLDETEREMHKINESRVSAESRDMGTLVNSGLGMIEHFFNRQGEISGLPTGFADLDNMTDGFHGGEMIVFAGRPAMGKTSLAMGCAEHVILESKVPVGVFSLEMSAESLVLRMMCSVARVNLRRIRDGFMNESDFPKLMSAAGRLSKAPLHIVDQGGLTILQLRARARRMAQQHGIKLFVIDYLQLLHSKSRQSQENRQQEIAEISSGIKALAKELNVPVIVLAQLNREIKKDKNRKPRMSDLRESGSIEQDADLVGMLYKPNAADEDDAAAVDDSEGVAVNLLITKQRNGPTGDVNLTFLKPYTRFESAAKFSSQD